MPKRRIGAHAQAHPARPERRFPYYAVLLYVGLVVALVVADRLARASGIDPRRLVGAFLLTMPACLAGSRALEVALHWEHFRAHPAEILRVRAGGAAMYGGLPPALVLSIPLARWIGIPIGLFWDVALVAILAGMVPTRLGCLGAGCCAGRESAHPFTLRLHNARGRRARRLPVPLFEALLGAALCVAGYLLWDRTPFPGALALLLCAGYAAGRLALDGLREERAPKLAGIGAYRFLSAAILVVGAIGLAIGCTSSAGDSAWSEVLIDERAGTLHLVASALLLIPVVRLFRFVGCNLVFTAEPGGTFYTLNMLVAVPDLGTGPVLALMHFLLGPEQDEISDSPFTLDAAGADPSDPTRLLFQKTADLPEGDYEVNCTASRADVLTRFGSCTGTLSESGLRVVFQVTPNSAPTQLQERFCFE